MLLERAKDENEKNADCFRECLFRLWGVELPGDYDQFLDDASEFLKDRYKIKQSKKNSTTAPKAKQSEVTMADSSIDSPASSINNSYQILTI